MKGVLHFEGNFPHFGIICKASELLDMINHLVYYDDGQGRNYDILDEEIYDI